jgi:hypothetical protein
MWSTLPSSVASRAWSVSGVDPEARVQRQGEIQQVHG